MAITFSIMVALWRLKEINILPGLNSILELGEQNWYSDTKISEIERFIEKFVPEGKKRNALQKELADVLEKEREGVEKNPTYQFDAVKIFYRALFDCIRYQAIDLNGTPLAHKFNLNDPVPMTEQFDIVTNFGTAEHVFNIAQMFRTIHERTKAGGFILHFVPNQGCYDHGFYNFHPTFFYDLAHANRYEIPILYYVNGRAKPPDLLHIRSREDYVRGAVGGELSDYSHLFVAFRKREDGEFKIPHQGYYTFELPDDIREAWDEMER